MLLLYSACDQRKQKQVVFPFDAHLLITMRLGRRCLRNVGNGAETDKPERNTSDSLIADDSTSIVLQALINTNELLIDFIIF